MLLLLITLGCSAPRPPVDGPGDDTSPGADTALRDEDGDGYITDDCDPTRADVHPGAVEYCDGADNDCDGLVDDEDDDLHATPDTTWYADADRDGYGSVATVACSRPDGAVSVSGDCDDADATVRPNAEEVCDDGVDQDCDGDIDEECGLVGETTLADADFHVRCSVLNASAGRTVAPAADLTGDDALDLVVRCGARDYEPSRVFVVAGPMSGDVVLDEGAAFVATGAEGDTSWGRSFAVAEMTGDGQPDLVVASSDGSSVFVFSGPLSGSAGPGDSVRELDLYYYPAQDNGFLTRGGDLDGDGDDDLLVGVLGDTSSVYWWAELGEVYVVPGGEPDATLDEAAVVVGQEGASVGAPNDAAGDLDGDGVDDMVLGPSPDFVSGGAAFVFFGPIRGTRTTEEADVTMDCEGGPTSIAGAGDVNGDGHADLLVGTGYAGSDGEGAAYVVTAPATGAVDAVASAQLSGEGHAGALVGYSLDGVGDVDGDGYADVLVGAPDYARDGTHFGAAALVYGPVTGTNVLEDADALFFNGFEDEFTGYAVGGLGDLDGDGFADVQVGSPGFSTGPQRFGSVFVYLGRAR